jgi:hypothetical protein
MLTALGWNPFIDKINGPIDWIDTYSTSTTAATIETRDDFIASQLSPL